MTKAWCEKEFSNMADGEMRDNTLPESHPASWTVLPASSVNFAECWVARQVITTKDLSQSQKLSQRNLAKQEPVQRIEDRRLFKQVVNYCAEVVATCEWSIHIPPWWLWRRSSLQKIASSLWFDVGSKQSKGLQ